VADLRIAKGKIMKGAQIKNSAEPGKGYSREEKEVQADYNKRNYCRPPYEEVLKIIRITG